MRFDDRLATVLAQPVRDAWARETAWRQLVDLLAQSAGDGMSDAAREAYARLRAWRDGVPAATRMAAARSLGGRRLPVELLRLFAEDSASVAAPLLGSARLAVDEWTALIPALTPTARALLRHRRDLPGEALRALSHYGQADLIIGAPPAQPHAAGEEEQPKISELVARIEAFRREHHPQPLVAPAAEPDEEPLDVFSFETDWEGTIDWVDAEERGALIGLSLAVAPELFAQGFDGQATGAFRRRAPFRDARLAVGGAGAAAGEWRVSGLPFFGERSGRFLGYRGKARRPSFAERAEPAQGLYGSNLTAESLRSLAHELRTPLNAIVGFAEMIEKQILGPVSAGYRARAAEILAEARRLAEAVDDLDAAARIETRSLRQEPSAVDASALIARIVRQLGARWQEGRVNVAADLPLVAGDRSAIERMFSRLIAATVALAEPGEPLAVSLAPDPHGEGVRLAVDRPVALDGRDEHELLDPGYSPEGEWPDAPLLGLGFSLRLVRSLAEAGGGRLTIEPARFLLLLPSAGAPAEETLVQG